MTVSDTVFVSKATLLWIANSIFHALSNETVIKKIHAGHHGETEAWK